jgi:low affinity Fe/Cu permease
MSDETMPSQVRERKGFFDKLADWADSLFSHPAFFAFEIALVVVWFATGFFMGFTNDLWHLLINTPTTIITFLIVGLSANSSRRANAAAQQKANATAKALLQLDVGEDAKKELRAAIGIEDEESS